MQLNAGQWAVIIICAILILGYVRGYLYNRQRAEQIYKWLKEGLSSLGEVTLGDKLPGMATGGRLEVNMAAAPMKRVEAVYLLAPRENLLFLMFHLLQGRHDELIVWVTYLSKPEQSVEAARKGDRQFTNRLKATDKPALALQDRPGSLHLAVEEKAGSTLADRVQAFMQHYQTYIIRLSIRPEKPHLYLRINLRLMNHTQAVELFSALKELGG